LPPELLYYLKRFSGEIGKLLSPPLISSMTRLVLFAFTTATLLFAPAPDFQIRYVWYLSVWLDLLPSLLQSPAAPGREFAA